MRCNSRGKGEAVLLIHGMPTNGHLWDDVVRDLSRQFRCFVIDLPGMGGTQRLIRAVGKAKAMDLILTGRMMDAVEAERSGLVARVVSASVLMEEAMKIAETIASLSLPSLLAAKEAINRALETSLSEGLRFERRVFHGLFATHDQKEGMAAFVAKRPASFRNE